MATPIIPVKVKLFTGIICSSEDNLNESKTGLIKKYGAIDSRVESIPFTNTEYYNEMGKDLYKTFFSFQKLIKREKIAGIKLFTNRLEKKISGDNKRVINIDPGYMTLSNVFLASCKDFYHRIYIGRGVFLENEYRYTAKKFKMWEWTYPDYKKDEYLDFFYNLRKIYKKQLEN